MKHITKYELFESDSNSLTKEQIEFLDKCTRGTWKLNPATGLVDVDGHFDCSSQNLMDFKEIKFGIVEGDFYCDNNKISSLEGVPQEVGKVFNCSFNKLASLEGGPQEVGEDFYCYNNKITSLEGATQEVRGEFSCSNNQLTSLEGGPQEVAGDFYCYSNYLTSLEGAPQEVGGKFYCYDNNLTSLEGGPQEVGGRFICDNFQASIWSLEWQIENLENYPILATIVSPESLQKFINKNPTKATITLKKVWKDLIKNPKYKHLKFPTSHKEDIDLLSDLSDLGL